MTYDWLHTGSEEVLPAELGSHFKVLSEFTSLGVKGFSISLISSLQLLTDQVGDGLEV